MITGLVTGELEATISLTLCGPTGADRLIDAVIDTGFNGWLSIPSGVVSQLGLPWRQRGRALLADGSECVFDMYEATVDWNGQQRRVVVHEADSVSLVGMSLLEGHVLTMEVVAQGSVSISQMDGQG